MQFTKYWLITQVAVALVVVRVSLRVVGLPRVLTWMHAVSVARAQDRDTVETVAYYTDRWLQLFPSNPRGNCLPRSLVLYRFARRNGFPVQFHCGVKSVDSALHGHAWLTLDGEPFSEPSNQWKSFAVTFSFPDASRKSPYETDIMGKNSRTILFD